MLNNLNSERIMDLGFPIRHLQDRLNEFRLDLHRLRLYRSESWNYDVKQRIEEYEQAIEILDKANEAEQSESTCNLQIVNVRFSLDDLNLLSEKLWELQDEGPTGEGLKSNELERLIEIVDSYIPNAR